MIYNILNEDNIVYENGYGISVSGDGESYLGWARRPYFKLYTGSSNPDTAENIIRIYFDSPMYVFPLHTEFQYALFFSFGDKKDLMKILSRGKIWTKMNNVMMKKRRNYEAQVKAEGYPIVDYYTLPDYTNLLDKDTAEYLAKNWTKISSQEKAKYGY